MFMFQLQLYKGQICTFFFSMHVFRTIKFKPFFIFFYSFCFRNLEFQRPCITDCAMLFYQARRREPSKLVLVYLIKSRGLVSVTSIPGAVVHAWTSYQDNKRCHPYLLRSCDCGTYFRILVLTIQVWKFKDFSVTQILREINFGESTSFKTAIFATL